jgi:thiamine-phosphate pyrophosphorylase
VILVTDPAFGDDAIERCIVSAAAALPTGALGVQLRDRSRLDASLRVFAGRLRLVTKAVGAWLIVNGDPVLARDVGADGVHLGRGAKGIRDARSVTRRIWISMAAHSDDDVSRASADGADAVLVSPIFPTRPPSLFGRPKEARGLDALRSARSLAGPKTAVFALGGVTPDNAAACARAGADGVAVLRGLLASADPGRAARAIDDAIALRW